MTVINQSCILPITWHIIVEMQGESDELSVASTEYLKQLNSVNLLLLR